MTPEEARKLAAEAFVYGYPLVDHYRIWYANFVNRSGSDFKAPPNQICNVARVFTPEDRAIQTPNSDTPYSFIGLDLRAEPMVITVPPIDRERYFSVQLIDAYTHNFDYIGSRATGNDGGTFLIAGPHWKGEVPRGITRAFHCETDFAFAFFRTQLFNPADIDNVKAIQSGYRVEPLSQLLKQKPPPAAPDPQFPEPLSAADQRSSLRFFDLLNFVLRFCPVHPSETEIRARLAALGLDGSTGFRSDGWPAAIQEAVKAGMADGWKAFEAFKASEIDTLRLTSADAFGTRQHLANNYILRMAGAVLGIYGNSKEEAIYPLYLVDSNGAPLDAAKNDYTLRFAGDGLPPVAFFWSLTLYGLPGGLLHANPLNRYLINSPMLPGLARDADGGITLHVQSASPGAAREANWLPAPAGPFYLALRLYGPKPEAITGAWKQPPLNPSPRG